MTRTFKRAILMTGILALVAGISLRPSTAADFYCVSNWADAGDTKETELENRFPSGRRPAPTNCRAILIEGEIAEDDSAIFAKIIGKEHPFLQRVLLWSSGGSVNEAIIIGRLIRREMLTTKAPDEFAFANSTLLPAGNGFLFNEGKEFCHDRTCHCASACFLIWTAGAERSGNALGLHRPSIRSTHFGNLPPERASGMYRLLLGDIDQYLTEMELPRRYIDMMTDTSSSDIRWLDFIEGSSIAEVPSIAEWVGASCGTMTQAETAAIFSIGSIGWKVLSNKPVSPQDRRLFDSLLKKQSEILECKAKKLDAARDSITMRQAEREPAVISSEKTETPVEEPAEMASLARTVIITATVIAPRIVILCGVLTLIGAPVMKIFARQVSLFRLAVIFGWAAFRVLAVAVIAMIGVALASLELPTGLNGLFSFVGMCAVGSLITHDLKRQGLSSKFPGVGAKTVTSMLILSWIIVGLYWYFIGF